MRKLLLPRLLILGVCLFMCAWPIALWAQDDATQDQIPDTEEEQEAPAQVRVEPAAPDAQIAERLTSILEATGWFVNPSVEVRDGVAFIDGEAFTAEQREWAGNLARNTQDVVAVVNRLEILPRPLWDFTPALEELRALWRSTILAIPNIVFGVLVLLLSWWIATLIARYSRGFFQHRLGSPLLASLAARAVAIPVFLLGLYLVLQVAGLTRLALTVLGGTGVVGIVVGFAFRDIAENFLASVLLSARQPFQRNDMIQVTEYTGIVQQMNTRSTILMTIDGNHVQIPNAIIFKNTIINYSTNPNRRGEFVIGIGYDSPILKAQEIITRILNEHPTVHREPEPLVLVDALATSTVNLRIYFWFDGTQFAPFKIKSSLLRLIKRALQDENISMPDEAREVIFPNGVPIVQVAQPQAVERAIAELEKPPAERTAATTEPEPVTSAGEGELRSNEDELRGQAERSRAPEGGEDLLDGS